jgi:hypothetical protein
MNMHTPMKCVYPYIVLPAAKRRFFRSVDAIIGKTDLNGVGRSCCGIS